MPFHQHPIRLLHLPPFKLLRQTARASHVTSQYDGTGRRPVQPMRHSQVDLARTPFALLQESSHADFQAVDARRRLRQQPAGLVHDQARMGFVEQLDFHGNQHSALSTQHSSTQHSALSTQYSDLRPAGDHERRGRGVTASGWPVRCRRTTHWLDPPSARLRGRTVWPLSPLDSVAGVRPYD